MSLFGPLVRTAVNVATLPADIVKDVVTLGDSYDASGEGRGTFVTRKLEKIKREAESER